MSAHQALAEQLRKCAGLFRLGRDIEAALVMVELFDTLLKQLADYPPGVAQQYPVVLDALLFAQQRQDWLGLADTLEVELMQLLVQDGASNPQV